MPVMRIIRAMSRRSGMLSHASHKPPNAINENGIADSKITVSVTSTIGVLPQRKPGSTSLAPPLADTTPVGLRLQLPPVEVKAYCPVE